MSRIGKKPVSIPSGVDVKIQGRQVTIKGPKGQLAYEHPFLVSVAVEDNQVIINRDNDTKDARARHGLVRALLQNMVTGVSEGFKRGLEIVGVGYRAQAPSPSLLTFSLGFSHPVEYPLPDGVTAEVDKKQTAITLSGIDKQLLGQVAANIRALRPPDSYKGKGVRYAGEHVRLKAGKTGKK